MKRLLTINQMTNKVALESMLNKTPCVERGDTEVVPVMDTTFERNGRTWRVIVCAGTFVIGTAIDAKRDARGEVSRESDIIKVML